MRILVFISDNRPLSQDYETADYNSLVTAINAEYCKRHDYDFLYFKPFLNSKDESRLFNCLDPNTNEPRHAAWSKLLSTSKALEMGYDYVVYIDSDCIFRTFSKRIEEVIHTNPSDIIFVNDKPWFPHMPCSGFFICKTTDYAKHFLKDWYNVNIPDKNTNHAWEQSGLWQIFSLYKIAIWDSMTFYEEYGQFLRHVTAEFKNDRISYFKNFIEANNIDFKTNISNTSIIDYCTMW
jgi:hypothetical protein